MFNFGVAAQAKTDLSRDHVRLSVIEENKITTYCVDLPVARELAALLNGAVDVLEKDIAERPPEPPPQSNRAARRHTNGHEPRLILPSGVGREIN